MKNLKKSVILGAVIAGISLTSLTAFATTVYKTPAEIVSSLTGRTVASVTQEHTTTGKTYGTIANEAGKLSEFRTQCQSLCDGTGSKNGMGRGMGRGMGCGMSGNSTSSCTLK